MKEPKATLFIHFHEPSPEQLAEARRETGCEHEEAGGVLIEFSYRESGSCLTEDDFCPEDPKKFLEQGGLMALAEQIMIGLGSERGISITEAVEKSLEKAIKAQEATTKISALEEVTKLIIDSMPEGLLDQMPEEIQDEIRSRGLAPKKSDDLADADCEGSC